MLSSATIARPGRHATSVLTLRVVSSNGTRPRHFDYPCASAYSNILLRRQYTTPTPSSSPSASSSSSSATSRTDGPPPPSNSEGGGDAQQKKPKLDLRPAPIKPKPPSSTATNASASANAKGKANAADALKSPAPPTRKSASNMKQLKAKSPYYAEKATASAPKTEKTARPSPAQQPASDAKASSTAPLSGLGAAKEEAMQAVKEAEAHGILKPPPEGANWFRRTLHQAIELAKFYFRGVKLVWQRAKTVREIKARIRGGGAPLTRDEFRFIETQKDDVRKIIPFLVIALILEEVIPLIAIYVPGMLPSTCILPSQRAKIEAKRAEKVVAFRKQYATVFGELKKMSEMRKVEGRQVMYPVVDVEKLFMVNNAPLALCGLLGLSTLGPDFMRVNRITNRLSFLLLDDHLLIKELEGTKADKMTDGALAEALQERAIPNPATLSRTARNDLMKGWLAQALYTKDDDEISRRIALVLTHT